METAKWLKSLNQKGKMHESAIAGVRKAGIDNKVLWMLHGTYSAVIEGMGLPAGGASSQALMRLSHADMHSLLEKQEPWCW